MPYLMDASTITLKQIISIVPYMNDKQKDMAFCFILKQLNTMPDEELMQNILSLTPLPYWKV